jgi:hypothetical protein
VTAESATLLRLRDDGERVPGENDLEVRRLASQEVRDQFVDRGVAAVGRVERFLGDLEGLLVEFAERGRRTEPASCQNLPRRQSDNEIMAR